VHQTNTIHGGAVSFMSRLAEPMHCLRTDAMNNLAVMYLQGAGTARDFAHAASLLSPGQCEVVDVRTKRGVTRALLFPKALLRAEWKAAAPSREALAMKRQRLRGRPKKRPGAPFAPTR
jgi:hypothetical protein